MRRPTADFENTGQTTLTAYMCNFIIIMELSAMKKNPVKCKVKFKELCWISFCLRYLLEKLCHYQAYFVHGQMFFSL